MLLVAMLAGCGEPSLHQVYGGGEAIVKVVPADEEGLQFEAVFPGATETQLFEDRYDDCTVYATQWEKSAGLETTVQVCGEDIVPNDNPCFEALSFWWTRSNAPNVTNGVWMGKSGMWNGERDEIEVEVDLDEMEGISEGAYMADVMLTNRCLGRDIPHHLEISWSFPDAHQEEPLPDYEPGGKLFDPIQLN